MKFRRLLILIAKKMKLRFLKKHIKI